jgi:hypothetical protein
MKLPVLGETKEKPSDFIALALGQRRTCRRFVD